MAFGVSKAIPRAAFCHAKEFTDITNTDMFNGSRVLQFTSSSLQE